MEESTAILITNPSVFKDSLIKDIAREVENREAKRLIKRDEAMRILGCSPDTMRLFINNKVLFSINRELFINQEVQDLAKINIRGRHKIRSKYYQKEIR